MSVIGGVVEELTQSMGRVLNELNDLTASAATLREVVDRGNLHELIKLFTFLRDLKTTIEREKELISSVHDQLNDDMADLMEALKVGSIKQDGRTYTLSVRTHASIPNNKREAGLAWLRGEADTPELIISTVNPKSLSSFVESYFKTYGKMPPEDAVTVYNKRTISVRKS